MFKKRNKTRLTSSAPREQSRHSASPSPTLTPHIPKPSGNDRARLSVTELQQRYLNENDSRFEEIDDHWEDEQLKKNSVFVPRRVVPGSDADPFGAVKQRIKDQIDALKRELET